MDFFEVVKRRRSIRKYKDLKVPDEVVSKAIDAALIAPNSSNLQTWQILAPIKWFIFNIAGLFKATPRRPWSPRDLDEVSIKSCALACQNFMLAISAQGYDTCPMEGLDETRLKRLLKLKCSSRIVMAISVGLRGERGLWGEQFRVPKEMVVFER